MLQGVTACHMVLQLVTGWHRVLQCVTACHMVLQGVTDCDRMSRGVTGFHRRHGVSQGVMGQAAISATGWQLAVPAPCFDGTVCRRKIKK